MQAERKTLKSGGAKIKSGIGVSQKKVRVYVDGENPVPEKRTKINAEAPAGGRQRRPLADIHNLGAGAVKKREKAQKSGIIKKADEGNRKQKGETAKDTSNVVKAIAIKKTATQIAGKEGNTECSGPGNKEEYKQEPDRSATSLNEENYQKEMILEQNHKVFSVTYYGTKIYKYLFALEKKYEIPENHLEGQVLNGLMRTVMVDWLAGVVDSLDLMQETFQLTVYILDKYMSINRTTTKASAQLIGLGALFVAAKYEETECIELNDLILFCNKKWKENDIKSIECTILETVNYQLGRPLAIHFIRRLSKISGASPMEHSYAKFFADTSLLSYQLCHVKPSLIAAASVFLALCISKDRIDTSFWTSTLATASTYRLEEFRELLPLMSRAVTGAITGELKGIQTRYSSSNLFCVSLMPGCRPETGIINHF